MNANNFLKLFKKSEVGKIDTLGYLYENRKKVVTFVPLKFVDKLTFEMSFAGAGKIGNYDMCSFRMKGLGTYRPGTKSNPFSGKKGKISYEEEVRLEVETSPDNLDSVIDALLANHPYEEVAYEIYDFQKRTKEPSIVIVNFKKNIFLKDVILKINNRINIDNIDKNAKIKNLCFADGEINRSLVQKIKERNCKLILLSEKNKIKFKNI